MHIAKVIALAFPFLADAVAGFTLPSGLANGVYRAYHDNEGREVHELVSLSEPVPSGVRAPQPQEFPSPRGIDKRGNYLWCGCGWEVDHGNCDAAVANLWNQLAPEPLISAYMSFYAISNDAVAFACNTGAGGDMVMEDWNLSAATQAITDSCGWYIAGTYGYNMEYPDTTWPTTMMLGYMQYYPGEDFCGNAASSPASSC